MSTFRVPFAEDMLEPSPRQNGRWLVWLRRFLIGVVLAIVLLLVASYIYYSVQLDGAFSRASQQTATIQPLLINDRDELLLYKRQATPAETWLTFNEIPPLFRDATIAVEDATFWDNNGLHEDTFAGFTIFPYETITQKAVDILDVSLLEESQDTFTVLHDFFLARILTQRYDKKDILRLYFNEAYYGNFAKGAEAAARTYFDKPIVALTAAETAFIVSLPQNPSELDPYSNFLFAKGQQQAVLSAMQAEGILTDVEYEEAIAEAITFQSQIQQNEADGNLSAPHFVLTVQQTLGLMDERALLEDGWQVTTTLDGGIQETADSVLSDYLAQWGDTTHIKNGAVVVLQPKTGELLAMVGNTNYFDASNSGHVNMALTPHTPGTTLLPFAHAAALTQGFSAADTLWDVPLTQQTISQDLLAAVPTQTAYAGPMLLVDGVTGKDNFSAQLQLFDLVGVKAVADLAQRLGAAGLALPAGDIGLLSPLYGGEATLLELTRAFATLGNDGKRLPFRSITRIVNRQGNVVVDTRRDRPDPDIVVSPQIAYLVTQAQQVNDNSAAIVTGKTADGRHIWAFYYSPAIAIGVWLGNSDGSISTAPEEWLGAVPVAQTIANKIDGNSALQVSLLVDTQVPSLVPVRPENVENKPVCPAGEWDEARGVCESAVFHWFRLNPPKHDYFDALGYSPNQTAMLGAWQLPVVERENVLCTVVDSALPEDAQQRLFVPAPTGILREAAKQWAQQNNIPIAPPRCINQ